MSVPASAAGGNELVGRAIHFDGRTVSFEGEVIGDVMVRGSHAWVNISDGQKAIGIWAPQALVAPISFRGDYSHRGDRVLVTGRFNRACAEHGGDLDIHADELVVVQPGEKIEHRVDRRRVIVALLLGAAALLVHLYGLWKDRVRSSA